ncbi:Retrovirus-related Pol polyprotein from transposon [Sesamum angolense]|uniref:Retrovirus-related Pol polyprotein from transposon n=1 Tax=Sesamum angolense TaxID=2727404 RepID=A0AAE1W2P4_9LAMI|nr:Retrovirus-related Pol polyprotein from transposon [Sesamum angolense]
MDPSRLGETNANVITHHLNIDSNIKPAKQKKRHFGPENDKLIATGHIEEIQFPIWLSSVVLVPKLRGKWRMCIDYRDLNNACPKDLYPFPRIDQLVDSTSRYELSSMMDASQGYQQIMLALEDCNGANIVITSPHEEGLEFTVKFGFKASNSEAEYEALMISMKMTHEAGARHPMAYSDSQLVVKQVEGTYEVKEENMKQYLQQIAERKTSFKSFQLTQIPREENIKLTVSPS